ncbi:MAG: hypothetical protein C4518_20435 [Desulfobacteraceae bacterium]|nr:MAG: hypothetical protein C4518_20435 [Desulfobacteraceae bacterium]
MIPDESIFIVSLDFELYWGVRDKRTIRDYKSNLKGTGKAIEEILAAFREYDIHATWATVGFLFYKDENSLKKSYPAKLPQYENQSLSPYQYINESRKLEAQYHFAPGLIDRIRECPHQEIGTHTFSHYHCLENSHTLDAFRLDLSAALKAGESTGLKMKSFVFPRNQLNKDIIPILKELGITAYRGNERNWSYTSAGNREYNTILRRSFRLLDAYLNLSGHHTYPIDEVAREKPYNMPSSRFLRPYSKKLSFFEPLRLKRIKRAMTYAAQKKTIFHLWWHPHNFGSNTVQSICFLKKILNHYRILKKKYGMQSLNMGQVSDLLDKARKNGA